MSDLRDGRLAAWVILWLAACSSSNGGSDAADVADDGTIEEDGDGEAAPPGVVDPPAAPAEPAPAAPPRLTPCPDGWATTTDLDGPDICEPWPDGDPAAAPQLTPCPAGWHERTDPTVATTTCDPWPEGGPPDCADDEAFFPGASACARLGSACGTAEWAADLPAAGVRYVRAGAPPGGDGSSASPFATLAEALAGARPGDVVALGRGTFDGPVTLPAGVTLWGACVAETLVTAASLAEDEATVTAGGADVVVRNLRLTGEGTAVRASGAGVTLTLRDVLVAGAAGIAVHATDGARLTADGVAVRGTRSQLADGLRGRGLQLESAAQGELRRTVLERNRDIGVAAFDPDTVLTLADSAVRDTQPRSSDDAGGAGAIASAGARIEATRTAVFGNRYVAAAALDSGSVLRLTDAVVADTETRASDGTGGHGLHAEGGGRLDARRVLLERNHEGAAAVIGSGTTMTLTDGVVRDTLPPSVALTAYGATAGRGGTLEALRVAFVRSRMAGLTAQDRGTTVRLTDVRVSDTASATDGTFGMGLHLQGGATVQAERLVLERNAWAGLQTWSAGTAARCTDLVIRDTVGQAGDRHGGAGILVTSGATVQADHVLLERNRGVAAGVAGPGSALDASDLVVRHTASEEADDMNGAALSAEDGGRIGAVRARLDDNRAVGANAVGAGSALVLTDAVVRDTQVEAATAGGGQGVVALDGGAVELTRVLLVRNRVDGAHAQGAGSSLRATDLTVTDSMPTAAFVGAGVAGAIGTRVELTRVRCERNQGAGLVFAGTGSTALLGDVVVLDTVSAEAGGVGGMGLLVAAGAQVTLARARMERNAGAALGVEGTGSLLQAEDVALFETVGARDGTGGYALAVQHGGRAEALRVLAERNVGAGIFASGAGTTLVLADAVVRDTQSLPGACLFGYGFELITGASAEATRVVLEGNREVGLLVASTGTRADLAHLVVRDTAGRDADGAFGRGLVVQQGAEATLRRGLFERNREVGVLVSYPDTRLDLEDVAVRETLPSDCGTATCPGGIGIGAYHGAYFTATRFLVEGGALCGVQLAYGLVPETGHESTVGGTADLHEGEVRGHPIGVNLQSREQTVERLQDRVAYRDNERNLDATALPVPGIDSNLTED